MKYPKMEWGTMEAIINKLGGMKGVREFLSGTLVVVKNTTTRAKEKLLELITTVRVSGEKKFVAKNNFNTINEDGVKIFDIYKNFLENFLDKVEENIPDAELKSHVLLKDSCDLNIIFELGKNYETRLAYIWSLMKLQPNGEDGVLLTNSYANVFYVRDIEGILWGVDVGWYSKGWIVNAGSIGALDDKCLTGRQVFSRN